MDDSSNLWLSLVSTAIFSGLVGIVYGTQVGVPDPWLTPAITAIVGSAMALIISQLSRWIRNLGQRAPLWLNLLWGTVLGLVIGGFLWPTHLLLFAMIGEVAGLVAHTSASTDTSLND